MSESLALALIAVAISLVAVILAVRMSGPRVTTIHTRRPTNTNDDTSDGDDKSQES